MFKNNSVIDNAVGSGAGRNYDDEYKTRVEPYGMKTKVAGYT